MPFDKGNKGKPKGSQNKVTKDAKQTFLKIMEGEVDHVQDALNKIRKASPYNYVVCLSKLMPYFMPKQIDIKSDGEKMAVPVIQLLPPSET